MADADRSGDAPRGDGAATDRAGSAVAVVGAGYVGITTAACLAHLGHRVVCTDIDELRITGLQRGEVPIREPGLDELVAAGLDSGRLAFVCDSPQAAAGADFVFLCVPTPTGPDGGADLSFLEAAAVEIGDSLRPAAVVVNKSTAPPGTARFLAGVLRGRADRRVNSPHTGEAVARAARERREQERETPPCHARDSHLSAQPLRGRANVAVVSNPEFLRQGSAVDDFLNPDRVVVGAADAAAAERVAGLYAGIDAPVLITDAASAETVKYAANAFLAMKLTYANAVAALCEAVGADVGDVLAGMGQDRRIGLDYLRPGPGWGGSCLPKDTRALIGAAAAAGYDFALLRGVMEANEAQFARIVDKVASRVALPGTRIALLGLAFKAGTDDQRCSPAVEIARRLVDAGAEVRAYDPAVGSAAAGIVVAADAYEACDGAAALVVATEWDEFKHLDFDRVAGLMAARHVIDARNLLDRHQLERQGFTYTGMGR